MVDILLNLSKFGYLLAGILTIGSLLAITFFATNEHGEIRNQFKSIKEKVSIFSLIYAISTLVFIFATLASILDVNLSGALNFTMLRSFVTQISLGKFLFFQSILGFVVAIASKYSRRTTSFAALLVIALISITLPVFQSHSASGGSHLIAIGTLVIHVLSITLWVGGLGSIVIFKSLQEPIVLKRYSQLAFWAALTVVASGLVNAWIRMNFAAAWKSTYALLLIEKIVLTLLLLTIAAYARKNLEKKIGRASCRERV